MASGYSGPPIKKLKQSLLSFSTAKMNQIAGTVMSASEPSVSVSDNRNILENRPGRVFEVQVDVHRAPGAAGCDEAEVSRHLTTTTMMSIEPDVR
jgi:hypothetical protein